MGTEITLTNKQRIDILKWVIKKLIKYKDGFMCNSIKRAISDKYNIEYRYVNPFHYFPELIKYKPSKIIDIDSAWFAFHEYERRVEILNNVIKELDKWEQNEH